MHSSEMSRVHIKVDVYLKDPRLWKREFANKSSIAFMRQVDQFRTILKPNI